MGGGDGCTSVNVFNGTETVHLKMAKMEPFVLCILTTMKTNHRPGLIK